jgi:hypothetical protein
MVVTTDPRTRMPSLRFNRVDGTVSHWRMKRAKEGEKTLMLNHSTLLAPYACEGEKRKNE